MLLITQDRYAKKLVIHGLEVSQALPEAISHYESPQSVPAPVAAVISLPGLLLHGVGIERDGGELLVRRRGLRVRQQLVLRQHGRAHIHGPVLGLLRVEQHTDDSLADVVEQGGRELDMATVEQRSGAAPEVD